MTDLMSHFESRLDSIIHLLAQLAEIESPTTDKAAVDQLGAFLAEQCRTLGAEVAAEPRAECGDIILAKWNGGAPGKPMLALCHIDTVHPLGALETMPLRREGDRLYGPGTVDMKGGAAIFLSALAELQTLGLFPKRPIWALFTTDEETGSHYSRDYLCEAAGQAGLVMVFEGVNDPGKLKTARKACGKFRISALGRAAHAGVEPEKGINAIIEAARQIERIVALEAPDQGTTVTPTIVKGGTRENVVPAEARLVVDVRVANMLEYERITQAMGALTPILPGVRLEIEGGFDRPPMERDALMVETFGQARAIAEQVGCSALGEISTGGGSDGNFTAAMGIPTLDGLGATGGDAHTPGEYADISSLAQRAALAAGLMLHWPAL